MQSPDDGAILSGNLIDGARVPRGDEVVAIFVLIDRVDMEIVPWLVRVQSGAGGIGVRRPCITHGRVDMIERAPLKQHSTRLDINFLENTLHHPPDTRFDIPRGHIKLALLVDGHERSFAVIDRKKLVHIARRHASTGLH